MQTSSVENSQSRELLNKNEKRAERPDQINSEAAFMNMFGNWKAFVGKLDLPVRPLKSQDLTDLRIAIATKVHRHENGVKGALKMGEPGQDRDAIKDAAVAKKAMSDTASAISGETELLNTFYAALFDGIQSKTPDIFVVAPHEVAKYLVRRTQTETQNTDLNRSPLYLDLSNEGAQECYVLTLDKGDQIKEIFSGHGHKVEEMSDEIAPGFRVNFGGLQLSFFYSRVSEPENKEAWHKATGKGVGDKLDNAGETEDGNEEGTKINQYNLKTPRASA